VKSKRGSIGSRVKHWQISLTIITALSASLALAEDFKTIAVKEYKNATVSRVEPDGIVVKTKSAVTKIYFTELPKEIQERFHYDAAKTTTTTQGNAPPADQTSPTAETSPAVIRELPKPPSQLDDAQFNDLRRRDWYEDLKAQLILKNRADYMLELMDQIEKSDSAYDTCSPKFFEMLAAERKAHRDNYRALSAIAAKIAGANSYDEYNKLKTIENQILGAIEAQKIRDRNDVLELRLHVSEFDAKFLENAQRYQ
jgi:hypothetical protein